MPLRFSALTQVHNLDLARSHRLIGFSDACRTYELTWAIREASERSRAQRLASAKTSASRIEEAISEEE